MVFGIITLFLLHELNIQGMRRELKDFSLELEKKFEFYSKPKSGFWRFIIKAVQNLKFHR
ncbi:hypothetical protein C3K47_02240 [Solitalea longa]|uniref:Uncharacterized protein n=1 Tax=Solitalea longa TaxID=2079460 RepID=A0A2S5A9S5_9SPHI|nr:hypothetical protein C3K47_02240 [Solitalea longa]